MKKTFLQNKGWRARKFKWLVVFLTVFLGLAVYIKTVNYNVSAFSSALAGTFFRAGNSVGEWWSGNIFLLKSKKELFDENLNLKEKNSELEGKLVLYELLKKENEELKNFLSQNNEKKFVFAAIISKPPQSPYDIFLIDAGSENGLRAGMPVIVYDNILLGYMADVFTKTSKIKLVSYPGEELNVIIASTNGEVQISAVAIGNGGGNMEIKLPNSIQVNSGDRVITTGTFPLLLGVVEKVEVSLSDPFQKIMFRTPVNFQELQSVMIEKTND